MKPDIQRELTSWQEIADRLQVTVRTAQEWEKKRGLPVRRLPGGRSRVYLRVRELDEWLDTQTRTPPPSRQDVVPRKPARAAAAVALPAIVITVVMVLLSLGPPAQPAGWRVIERAFVVNDEDGEELWRASFEQSLQLPQYEGDSGIAPVLTDLDDDGNVETLFVYKQDAYGVSNELICFDAGGNELWRFVPGAEINTGTEPFENAYSIANLLVVDLSDGGKGVLVVSIHYMQYPTQIALVSPVDGSLLSEYWHSGHIGATPQQLAVGDFDDDGSSEVYAAGISNSHNQATLVVLALESMSGASREETPEYQLDGFAPAHEIARILFPRSSMSLASDPYNRAFHVWLSPDFIGVGVNENELEPYGPTLIYHLRPDFVLDHVVPSSPFEIVHERLQREGIVKNSLAEELELFQTLRYVSGPESVTARR